MDPGTQLKRFGSCLSASPLSPCQCHSQPGFPSAGKSGCLLSPRASQGRWETVPAWCSLAGWNHVLISQPIPGPGGGTTDGSQLGLRPTLGESRSRGLDSGRRILPRGEEAGQAHAACAPQPQAGDYHVGVPERWHCPVAPAL